MTEPEMKVAVAQAIEAHGISNVLDAVAEAHRREADACDPGDLALLNRIRDEANLILSAAERIDSGDF